MNNYYIAELDLPSTSAYAQHVLKMCDALAKKNRTTLIVFSKEKNYTIKKIKKDYLIKNIFYRINFAFFVKRQIKYDRLIISRSIITSILLTYFRYFNFLEIHHKLTGITKYVFKFRNFFLKNRYLKIILIHKNLLNILKIKKNYLILDDAVDVLDFKNKKQKKTQYDCTYIGSLFKGKGIEIIIYLAMAYKHIKFYIYGDLNTIDQNFLKQIFVFKLKNIFFRGFINYSQVPNILGSSKILIMPYLNKVMVNSKTLDVSNVMSPLKMFDYLASGKIIIASDMSVYKHILKNNFNSILADPKNLNDWKKKFKMVIEKKIDLKRISKNALITANKFTWEKRVNKIHSIYHKIKK